MTELQKKEFELLKIFVDICNDAGLRYYLVCGSALGAVKYRGFVPWDDDIDVGLPRRDYEQFLEIAPSRLPDWVFLQNYRTDPAYPHVASKLRDSMTTYIEIGVSKISMHHGVYIDVFPLDGYPQGRMSGYIFELHKKILTWKQFCVLEEVDSRRVYIRNRIFRMLGYANRTAKTLKKLDRLISRYSTEESPIWCNHGNWQGKLEYANKKQYGNGIHATFEGLDVIVPENYDAYLTQKYGDWRSDLPEEEKVGHHFYSICDLDKPYTAYFSMGCLDKKHVKGDKL